MPLTSLTRGKIAKLADYNSETIRYYERIGLLAKPQRGSNGYRYYDLNHLHRLRFIKRAKQLGFTNDNVRELLEISCGLGKHTRAEVKTLTENHIELVKQPISDLQKMEETSVIYLHNVTVQKRAWTIARYYYHCLMTR